MKTNYLLPHKYKVIGWVIFILGVLFGLYIWITDYESNILVVNVLSIFNDELFSDSNKKLFEITKNNIIDELTSLAIIIGGLLVGFTKEKVEDEFIYKLRKDSLVWAIIFNYAILVLTIIFVYNFTFFHILVFNMFTPLLFFIIRFNFLKLKSGSDEE